MGIPCDKLYWVFVDDSWCNGDGSRWELTARSESRKSVIGVQVLYTNVLVLLNGQLLLHGQAPIQCASVEEAKELGVTTYLLTKKGE